MVTLSPAGSWAVSTHPSASEASQWYGTFVHAPTTFQYAAWFDRTDESSWPRPVEEILGSRGDMPPWPDAPAKKSSSTLLVPVLVGGAALAGLIALAGGFGRSGESP